MPSVGVSVGPAVFEIGCRSGPAIHLAARMDFTADHYFRASPKRPPLPLKTRDFKKRAAGW